MILKKWISLSFSAAFLAALLSCASRTDYQVGDLVMSDGSVLSKEAAALYKGKATPVAVIFSTSGADSEVSERVLGVALDDIAHEFPFATDDITHLLSPDAHFQAASVKKQEFDAEKGVFKNAGFTGNLDGRKVTYNLSERDEQVLQEHADIFPSLQAVAGWAEKTQVPRYAHGWYLPSAAELYELFEVRAQVNETILAAGGKAVERQRYWSSSSVYEERNHNFLLDAATGEVVSTPRLESHTLRAVYCFSDRKARTAKEKYNLGGVVYDDGTVLHYSQIADYAGSATPVAVIFSCRGGHFEESGRVLGVGLDCSPGLAFAAEGSLGERTNMLANQSLLVDQYFCEPEGIYANTGFLGLLDGRKSWQNIAYYDKNAKKSAADYPAFDYAVNYGRRHGFKKYADGWYLPTVSEAYELAEYAAVVNRTLALLGRAPLELPIWTSSQDYDEKDIQYLVYMSNAEVSESLKRNAYGVCAIYCFY